MTDQGLGARDQGLDKKGEPPIPNPQSLIPALGRCLMTETSLGKSRRCSEAVQPLWPRARPGKRLRANEIHIWSACLTRPEGVRVPFLETLSAEERERAARFHFHQDQRRWIICRGVLRTLL